MPEGSRQAFMTDSPHCPVTSVCRPAALLVAALALATAVGCTSPRQQRMLAEVQVILSERPVDEVLEPDPKSLREVFTYAFDGQGKLRAVTRYESTRLRAMADRDKGAVHVFRCKLQFVMYDDVVVEVPASSPGMDQLKMDFWVSPEACCGMMMSATVVVGAGMTDQDGMKFTCDWPSARRVLIELPSKRLKGRWIWLLMDLRKEKSKPVDPRKG